MSLTAIKEFEAKVFQSQNLASELNGLKKEDFANRAVELAHGMNLEFNTAEVNEYLAPRQQLMQLMKKHINELESIVSMDDKIEKVLELAKSEVDSTLTKEQVKEMLPVAIALNSTAFEEGELSEDELESVTGGWSSPRWLRDTGRFVGELVTEPVGTTLEVAQSAGIDTSGS
ncbi:MAG TPA: hypothetical protein VK211_07820 [Kamptonema sp.]|nr:hypothetical protein [Kamptonema sp.]